MSIFLCSATCSTWFFHIAIHHFTCSLDNSVIFSSKCSATLQLLRNNYNVQISPPLSIARDSSVDLSKFEQGGVKEVAQCSKHNANIRSQVLVMKSAKF